MENPLQEISTAINRCAGAASADAQIDAFQYYFTKDASFLHPLCYVPSGPDSRKRVIGIYLFYRAVVWKTAFEVQTTALDEKTLHLYVDLIQKPHIRLVPFVMAVPMHIHFRLRRVNDKYYIASQEDIVQPRSMLMALPMVRYLGAAFYFFCEMLGLVNAYFFIVIGIWRPAKHLDKPLDNSA